jgi:hypothetical protein
MAAADAGSEPQAGAAKPQPEVPTDSKQSGKPKVDPDPEVLKTVIDSYYSRGVDAADSARQRAQQGYAVASALAAAVVAAGVFTNLSKQPLIVKVCGLAALLLWFIAALLFMWAVSVPSERPSEKDKGWTSAGAFIVGVAGQVNKELAELNRRLVRAVWATVLAAVVTIAAFSIGTLHSPSTTLEQARLQLTARADRALRTACPHVASLYGQVDPTTLSDAVVTVKAPPNECGLDETTLRIPKGDIVAEEDVIRFPIFPQG